MTTVRIEYVGKKPTKADTVAGTGIVWMGQGDVQDVPEEAVARLLRHPDVWALAGKAATRAAPPAPPPAPAPAPTGQAPSEELYGTNHDDPVFIGQDVSVPLIDLIAHVSKDMGTEAWNALTDDERYELVDAEIEKRRAALPPPPATKVAAKKAPAKKAAKAKK